MSVNREIELKALISSEYIDRIRDLPAIKKRAVGRAQSRKLSTVYFDTPDYALRKQGLSLRIRKVGGAFIQCIKQTHKRMGGILVRTEWEGPVPSQDPAVSVVENKKLRRRLRRAGINRAQPVFNTDFRRGSRTLEFDDGSKATLDVDVGKIVAGERSAPICEFELELVSGAPERIFELASEIVKAVPFRIATTSKASRGYALLTNWEPQSPKPAQLDFAKDTTVEQVLTDLVQYCLDKLQVNEAVVLNTENSKGVHQMRIALRQLRVALRLFKSALPADQYDWLTTEAKWLTSAFSESRDWDVFVDRLAAPLVKRYAKEQGFDAFLKVAERARHQSRQQVRDTINTERYTNFLLRISAWVSGQAWREQPVSEFTTCLLDPIGDHCTDLLQKHDQVVRTQGQRVNNLSLDNLHELRIAVKRLRYAVDFFERLYPKKQVKTYKRRLSRILNRLGYLQDVVAADALIRNLADVSGVQKSSAWTYAGGMVVGWHRHAASTTMQNLEADMTAFLRTEPFWHKS